VIDLPLVSLDLELLDAENGSEIVEVGAVKFRGAETLGTFSALVRPRGTLSHHLGDLTGLTAEDLRGGEALDDVLARLSQFVGGAPIVGQSIGLDVDHLKRAGLALRNPLLDTFELAILVRPGLRAYDLLSIARALGIEGDLEHRALSDALLARDVFLRLVEHVDELGIDVVSQVVRLAGPLDWPLKVVFAEAQRARLRDLAKLGPEAVGAGLGPLGALPPPPEIEPLDESSRFVPLDAPALVRSIQPGGKVADAIPGFEERPEQQQMLAAVAEAFNAGEELLVEAGTGTGKSLAYLLPALHFAVANGRRVVVSTNTINLQDQLRDKDLPDLLRATGLDATVATLKGRTNYLCLRRFQTLLQSDDLSPAERMLLIRTLLWLPRTATGDRAELRLSGGEEEAWGKLSAVAEACSPLRCPYHRAGSCFIARARRGAEGAHVVIVNHALLLLDAVGGNQVLPEYLHLVVDEAHHLEDEATTQLSKRVTHREMQRRLDDLLQASAAVDSGLLADASAALQNPAVDTEKREGARSLFERGRREVAAVRAGTDRIFVLLAQFVRGQPRRSEGGGPATVRITRASRAQPLWSEIDVSWGEVGRDVLALQRTLADMTRLLEALDSRTDEVDAVVGELGTQATFWDETRRHLSRVIAEDDRTIVAWLGAGQADELGVSAAPLDVSAIVRDRLIGPRATAVLTSATLTSEGRFAYVARRLGLTDARTLAVGSPFDYQASTLVYLPVGCPEPNQGGYQRAVEKIVLDVATELRGRTLVLLTSHSQLRATYSALRDPLDARKILLLGQGVGGSSRARLLETFKSGRPSVLLGTSSFWEGVDVVGDALSCLIITRLPFAMPTDPIVEARSELFDDPFSQYSLPQAILRFRQGFGRLIRSRSDRGVMLVLDSRIRTRRYGRSFLNSLPFCSIRVGPAGESGQIARTWIEGLPLPPG